MKRHYKIKLRTAGCRLVYRIDAKAIVVITLGKRERSAVYEVAGDRAKAPDKSPVKATFKKRTR